jgi:hypothetical protein
LQKINHTNHEHSKKHNDQKNCIFILDINSAFGNFIYNKWLYGNNKKSIYLLKNVAYGYPPYFMLVLGITKIAGVIALLMSNLKKINEWAIAGFAFDAIFAFISGRTINSNADCIKAVIVFCLLILTYFSFKKKETLQEVNKVTE